MKFERSSGILLNITALPGPYGIGTMGKEAYKFVDTLIMAGQKLWQIYPLGPTGYGDSPYQCFSAFAGNPYLIDMDTLADDGLVTADELKDLAGLPSDRIDYGQIYSKKMPILEKLYDRFEKKAAKLEMAKYQRFCEKEAAWLDDYALFMALKINFGGKPWSEWDNEIKMGDRIAKKKYTGLLKHEINAQKFMQYLFFKQWFALKGYANSNGIKIIGDIPIFIAQDSADAWSNPELFLFDENRNPLKIAGVPPDYFSRTGQLWGNPLYDWAKNKETGYKWWIDRTRANMELYDIIRIDHFRGFAAYWEIPFGETTAINGRWIKGPGKDLFDAIEKAIGTLPFIAEDLGVITPDVVELRTSTGLPGMKILQFAFDSNEDNDYMPHTFELNSVVYTGTHDNDMVKGWFENAIEIDRQSALDYFGTDGSNICWDFVRAAWASPAVIAVAPIQDLLGLGSEARINTPGTASGNWTWRLSGNAVSDELIDKLAKITKVFER